MTFGAPGNRAHARPFEEGPTLTATVRITGPSVLGPRTGDEETKSQFCEPESIGHASIL